MWVGIKAHSPCAESIVLPSPLVTYEFDGPNSSRKGPAEGGVGARVVAKRKGAKRRLCLIIKKGVSLVAAGQRGAANACRDNAVTMTGQLLLIAD